MSNPASPSCSIGLTVGNDGTVAPLFCSDGSPNLSAVAYYEGVNEHDLNAAVLRLSASSTRAQVMEAMCADINASMGLQTEQQAYALAARRNGWRYDINTVTNLNCSSAS